MDMNMMCKLGQGRSISGERGESPRQVKPTTTTTIIIMDRYHLKPHLTRPLERRLRIALPEAICL